MARSQKGINQKLITPDQLGPDRLSPTRPEVDELADKPPRVSRTAGPPSISWNMVCHFLAVADAQSFKGAARLTGRSINTLRNHIDQLEAGLGTVLFHRSCRGIALTAAGHDFYAQAKLMRPPAPLPHGISGKGGQAGAEGEGVRHLAPDELRLTVTEGLGTFWIIPRLSEFKAREPDMRVRLDCRMAPADMSRRTVDIAVQLDRPSDPDLICVKLGTLHLMPFASLGYIAKHGAPRSIDDALKHRFVVQIAEQVRSDIFALYAGAVPPPELVAMETNTSSAHYWAVANDVGIGILPTYARAVTRRVVPLDMEIKLRRDIWLIYHPDIRRSAPHMRAVEWLREAFNPRTYPWFADHFVHPDAFEARFDDGTVVPLFAGFGDLDELGEGKG